MRAAAAGAAHAADAAQALHRTGPAPTLSERFLRILLPFAWYRFPFVFSCCDPAVLRLIFAGTPDFAASALAALADAGHDVALVLTRADQPAGRGRAVQQSAVKQLALQRGFAVEQPRTLRDEVIQQRLYEVAADVMVVAAYGLILPAAVLQIPRLGCLNIHASLLPRWRGAAPIQRAIEAGDAETGITIMQMDEGLDTGAMRLIEREPIRPDDTGGSLHDRLAALGARAIVAALAQLEAGTLPSRPQPEAGVTYAHKLGRADAAIDWRAPAARIVDKLRAFDPVPGATATLLREGGAGETVKVWRARVAEDAAHAPGTILRADAAAGLAVACGDGVVELLELQKAGARRLPVADFLRGFPVAAGERFAVPETTLQQS
ncbi:MAG: methionyl-tRNA formyltransferase [Burkholderiales bacterium]|nr:methionyl-tRNA formyltransferase [Burkholderiales bacterium]